MKIVDRFKIVEFANPGGSLAYRVIGRKTDGQQVRQNFADYAQATGRKQELEIEALNLTAAVTMRRTRLTDMQLAEAEGAFQKLEGRSHSLAFAVDYLLRNWRPSLAERSVKEAFANFLADKSAQNLRERTLSDLRNRLKPLKDLHGDHLVSDITVDHIKELIFKPGRHPLTLNGYRRALHSFFGWCLKHDYCATNPVAKTSPAKVERGEPKILSLAEAKALLRAALSHKNGVLVPYISLALFSGLRPTELSRIDSRIVDLKNNLLRLGSEVAKLRQRRIVELPENLTEWLMPCGKKSIVGPNWRRDFDAVRRMAGFRGSVSRKKCDANLKQWPEDVLRHTALSFHLAFHKNEGKTAEWGGNSPDTLHRFYKGLVTRDDADAFWKLTPNTLDAVIIALPTVA